MASTAWTATRADLVKALADTRAEAARVAAERDQLQAEARTRRERDRDAKRRYRNDKRRRDKERDRLMAELTARGNREALELQEAFRRTRPDPNADLHRRVLIAALKEKP